MKVLALALLWSTWLVVVTWGEVSFANGLAFVVANFLVMFISRPTD